MTKLPPPPTVGRGSTPTDDAARLSAERDAARAELPESVTDLPDAWLLDVEPPPPPAPLRAEAAVDEVAPPPQVALPEVAPPEVAPPEVASQGGAPSTDAARDDAPTAAAPPEPRRVPTSPPAVTVPPTSGGIAPDRRTIVAVAAILGTALVAVLVARCSSSELAARAEPIADATARGGGNPLADGGAVAPGGRAEIGTAGNSASRRDGEAQDGAANGAADRAADRAGDPDAADEPEKPPAPEPTPTADAPAADTTAGDPGDGAPTIDDEPTIDAAADAAVPASADPKAARPSARTDSAAGSGSSTPADPPMTAEESLAKARAAWKAGNAKDTYKYANKSRFKQPSDEATELATLAACKMKLDDSAKASYRQLDGDRKKRTRIACRDFDVRVGL